MITLYKSIQQKTLGWYQNRLDQHHYSILAENHCNILSAVRLQMRVIHWSSPSTYTFSQSVRCHYPRTTNPWASAAPPARQQLNGEYLPTIGWSVLVFTEAVKAALLGEWMAVGHETSLPNSIHYLAMQVTHCYPTHNSSRQPAKTCSSKVFPMNYVSENQMHSHDMTT